MQRSILARVVIWTAIFILGAVTVRFGVVLYFANKNLNANENEGAKVQERKAKGIGDDGRFLEKKPDDSGALPFLAGGQDDFTRRRRMDEMKLLAKSRISEIKSYGEIGRQALTELQALKEKWDVQVKTLLIGESGKRIAASDSHVEQVAAILDKRRLDPGGAATASQNLSMLVDAVAPKDGEEPTPTLPSLELLEEVKRHALATTKSLEDWKQDSQILDNVIKECKDVEPSPKVLDLVLKERNQSKLKARADAIVKARDDAFAEATKKLADTTAAVERNKALIEAARLEEAARVERLREKSKLADQAAKRERDALEQKFEKSLPDIKLYLPAFTNHGYAQPKGVQIEFAATKGPMSYRLLKLSGALNQGRPGLETLALIGSSFANDRFKKNFPEFLGGEFAWKQLDKAFVQRAQDLLVEFGPLMVEKGLLAD